MTWRIPHVEIGDKVRLIQDVTHFNSDVVLKAGEVFEVADVGKNYGLPFVYVEVFGHDIQLQPRSYEKVEGSE